MIRIVYLCNMIYRCLTLLCCLFVSLSVWADDVTGYVTDAETGETLIGATVRVEGTQIGVMCDEDGRFVIDVPEGKNHSLTVSFIGYEKLVYPLSRVKSGKPIRLKLKALTNTMNDVVVTGVYERKKESFTGSAATYTGKELRMLGAQSVLKNLSILDPSFKINENSLMGSNPNAMPNIEVRGKTSIMGLKEEYGQDPNQPLFILDGFETDVETVMDLNMNRIQSITILKDAASTAIYGSKAANGVVVIETIRPEHGRLRLNYKGDYGLTWADLTSYNLMNAREKMQFEEVSGLYTDRSGVYANQLELDELHNERLKEIARGVDTYWLSEPLRLGFDQKHNVYAEGGEEKIRYGLGLTYGNTEGVMKESYRKTVGLNLDLIYRTGIFQFSNKFILNNVRTSDPTTSFNQYAEANPYYRKHNAQGGVDKYLYVPENNYESPVPNPLYNASLNSYDRSKALGFTDNFVADAFFNDWLRARVKFGVTHTGTTNEGHISPLDTRFDSADETKKGSYNFLQTKSLRYEGDANLTFGKLFADAHMVNLVAGMNLSHIGSTSNGYSATGFTDNFVADAFFNDWLRARVKFGVTHTGTTDEGHLSPLDTRFDIADETKKGSYNFLQTKSLRYEGDANLTFGKLFADAHMVNLVAGVNLSHVGSTSNGYSATGFTEDAFDAPSFANRYVENGKPRYMESTRRSASYYVNGGYQFRERYLLDVNWRYDGSSVFGSENRFRHTWSTGIGWNMHKERWMSRWLESQAVTLLKLRTSIGNPGNQSFSAYQSQTTYQFVSLMNNVFGSGVLINSLGNPDLRWQSTLNWTIGLDLEAWKKRVSLSADYFIKDTDPLLANITTPGSLGVKQTYMNLGGQQTKGVEATLRVTPISRPQQQINWNILVNARHYVAEYRNIGNALDALNETNKLLPNEMTRYYDGGSPTAIWGVQSAGIDPATGKEIFIKKDGTYTFNYSTEDEVILGDTRSKLEGTLGTSLYWKGLTIGAYFSYELGGQVFNTDLFNKVENIDFTDINYNQDRRALYDRWSPQNPDARYKGISLVQTTDKSSRFVMDRSTFQGTSLLVSYQFPQRLIAPAKLSALTLQCNMNDIFYKSTVKQERGIAYPYARTVSFTLSASF